MVSQPPTPVPRNMWSRSPPRRISTHNSAEDRPAPRFATRFTAHLASPFSANPSRWLLWIALLLGTACTRELPERQEDTSRQASPTATTARSPALKQETRTSTGTEAPRAQPFMPRRAHGERLPLLLYLHGLGSSGARSAELLGLAEFATRERALVVAPDGTRGPGGHRFWNAHPACCDFAGMGTDHVSMVSQLITELIGSGSVDPAEVYVIGFSNGGFMAHRLACELGRAIAGAGSIAGAAPGAELDCRAEGPTAILEVHGTADDVVSYDGGTVFGESSTPTHGSARDTLLGWGRRLGCNSTPRDHPPLDLVDALRGNETLVTSLGSCRFGSVTLWTVSGGSHALGSSRQVLDRVWRHLRQAVADQRGAPAALEKGAPRL